MQIHVSNTWFLQSPVNSSLFALHCSPHVQLLSTVTTFFTSITNCFLGQQCPCTRSMISSSVVRTSLFNKNISPLVHCGDCIVAAWLHQYQQQVGLVACSQIQVYSLSSCVLVPIIDQTSVKNLIDDILRNRLPSDKNISHQRLVVEEIPVQE
jgi:hypothetical protein